MSTSVRPFFKGTDLAPQTRAANYSDDDTNAAYYAPPPLTSYYSPPMAGQCMLDR